MHVLSALSHPALKQGALSFWLSGVGGIAFDSLLLTGALSLSLSLSKMQLVYLVACYLDLLLDILHLI